MKPETFTTAAVEEPLQYEAWRAWFSPLLEVVATEPPGRGFVAENQVWKLGSLAISRVAAPAVRVMRRRANIRRDPVDHWVLSHCSRGTTHFATEQSSLVAPAGRPYLWSLADESRSMRTPVERMQIFLPRDAFRGLAPLLDRARGSVIDTPLGHLLGDFLTSLWRRLPELTSEDVPGLTRAMHNMVAACVAPSRDRLNGAQGQIDFSRLERVRQAVRRNLRSPDLDPASLCRLVGISRSNLYRLFDDKGGVARYIHNQRLLAARAALCDPASRDSIAAIAEEFCFADASSFSRAFRKEFGHSPSEIRGAALSGLTPPGQPRRAMAPDAGQFGDLLRGL